MHINIQRYSNENFITHCRKKQHFHQNCLDLCSYLFLSPWGFSPKLLLKVKFSHFSHVALHWHKELIILWALQCLTLNTNQGSVLKLLFFGLSFTFLYQKPLLQKRVKTCISVSMPPFCNSRQFYFAQGASV